ncbi:MAG: DedA family protein [Cytophagaceae bacterium]|jgi:membrane-associated protein|nr:DedA family protein [Cytophagaceae bacterium]
MSSFIEILHQVTDPESIIKGGLFLILIIIFAENGVFFGFFLPGDTLLFTTGLLNATGILEIPTFTLVSSICLAAYAGSWFGYWFGKTTGSSLFNRNDTLFFKKKYMFAAESFFHKHGATALIMARFLPIIRTFAPILSGIIRYPFGKFMFFNVLGGTIWVVSLVMGGYYLGIIFPDAKQHLEYIILGIVIITWVPVIKTYLNERKKQKNA